MRADQLILLLPKDDKECLKLLMYLIERRLVDSPFKIWIRKHHFAYAGFIENMNVPRPDSQYGRNLPWLSGWKSNGGNSHNFDLVPYDEPRMHKMPITGELKDTVLMETDMFMLSARNSEGMGNDLEDYTYEVSENELNQHTRMALQLDTLNASVMDLEDKVNEHRIESERNLALANDYGARAKKAESESRRLREYNFELEEQVQGLLRERKILIIKSREDESELVMKEQNAGELGQLRGMTEAQIMSEAVDKHNEISSKLEEISSHPGHQGSYAEMKKTLGNLEKEIKSIKDNKTENTDKKEVP